MYILTSLVSGTELKCPIGQVSPNGFTPGCYGKIEVLS